MVRLKFTTDKTDKQLAIIPTVVVDYSDKAKKAIIGLFFWWLNGMLGIYISWTRKVKNSTVNGVSDEAKYDLYFLTYKRIKNYSKQFYISKISNIFAYQK